MGLADEDVELAVPFTGLDVVVVDLDEPVKIVSPFEVRVKAIVELPENVAFGAEVVVPVRA